jgi:hypothetical protein
MITRVILSIIVAVVVGIVASVIGKALVDAGVANVGGYIDSLSVLIGIVAGIWYYFAGPYPARQL